MFVVSWPSVDSWVRAYASNPAPAISGEVHSPALGLGSLVDVTLEVSHLHVANLELCSQEPGQVAEVAADALEGVCLERAVTMDVEVTVAEITEGRLRVFRRGRDWLRGRRRRVAVVPHEVDDVHAGRQGNQALPEPHQELIDLGGLGLRLRLGNPSDGEDGLLPLVSEEDSVTAVPLLDCHVAPSREMPPRCDAGFVTKMLPSLGNAAQVARRWIVASSWLL